jgi:hypothetical protein
MLCAGLDDLIEFAQRNSRTDLRTLAGGIGSRRGEEMKNREGNTSAWANRQDARKAEFERAQRNFLESQEHRLAKGPSEFREGRVDLSRAKK